VKKGKNRSNWYRRFCAFVAALIGMLACAGSLMLIFDRVWTSERLPGLGYFAGGLLLIVVGGRLSRRRAHLPWYLQLLGVIGFGSVTLALATHALIVLLTQTGLAGNMVVTPVALVIGGVIFLLLTSLLVTDHAVVIVLWFFAALLTVLLEIIELATSAQGVLASQQPGLVFAACLSLIPTGIGLFLVRGYTPAARVAKKSKVAAKTTKTSAPPVPQYFPTVQHELLARGRFCELFGVPCTDPCPLSTMVATKYQQLRLEHERAPQVLEALEKAYIILITPRQRALCNIAHSIMRIKAKELGPQRFSESEIELWTRLWARLQDTEIKGDPQRATEMRNVVLKEL
jgi:hypothetical protein